jgi:TRAP-type C4-dicarboxylate transport system substrate-binding protein
MKRSWAAGLVWLAALSLGPGVVRSSSVPATTPDGVVTLRIGTYDVPDRLSTDQIEQFAAAVAERGDGSIVIEPVWHAAGDVGNGDFDQHVARMVTSGELEMGLIPARAWDTEGVTTLRALQTPFLITDESLTAEIVSDDDLAGELMSGLDAAGVVGLALFPEGLRHPFSTLIFDENGDVAFGDPLLGPDDYQGAVMGWITSAQTAVMFDALGVTRFDDSMDPATLVGRESNYFFAPPGTATGNVTFFPKVNSLVINADVWAGLTADQQAIMTDAAADTRDWAIVNVTSDHDAALQRCANGFGIVLASDEDLAGLIEATAPVVAELREDPATAAVIDEITALRDALPPAETEPVTCDPAPLPTTPSVPDTAAAAPAGNSAEFPEGVYRHELTIEEVVDAGIFGNDAPNFAGIWELTFADGAFIVGGIDNTTGEPWHDEPLGYCVEGDRIAIGVPADEPECAGGFWSARWVVDGDELRLVDFEARDLGPDPYDSIIVPAIFANHPWLRTGDAPVATNESSEPASTAAATDESTVADT